MSFPIQPKTPFQAPILSLTRQTRPFGNSAHSPKDVIHFGMRYFQISGPTASRDPENPICRNNCLVNSIQNLLAYYGYPDSVIENLIHDALPHEIKKPKHIQTDQPVFKTQSNGDIELNPTFIREFLSNSGWGLGMNIKPYSKQEQSQIMAGIDQRKPILVFAEPSGNGHTLAVNHPNEQDRKHRLFEGHAYLVIPDRHSMDWIVQDSWKSKETRLSADRLKRNLESMPEDASTYNIIGNEPSRDLMGVYLPGRPQTPSRSEQFSSNQPVVTKPVTTTRNTDKPSLFQRLRQWFQRQTQRFNQGWRRFTHWVKSWSPKQEKAN